jgi:mTERF domain-containing protein, mitochondrial
MFVPFVCLDKHALAKRFDYLHNVIGFSHDDIVRWPQVLRTRTPIIRQRHLFLKLLRRDNFDSTRENYVSPRALATGRDVEFCDNVAKVPVKQFNEFLKTL